MLKINLAKLCFTRNLSGFTAKQFCYISLDEGGGVMVQEINILLV